jgi:hypothetical protein
MSAGLAALALAPDGVVLASSHREAPFISRNPKLDGTDVYVFNSYEAGRTCPTVGSGVTSACGYVTLIANYIPVEPAAGGPNFFTMDPNAIYEIEVDNNGDGVEDLTFQFKFTDALAGASLSAGAPALPFAYVGGTNPGHGFGTITEAGGGVENVSETYSLTVAQGPRRTPTSSTAITNEGPLGSGTVFLKPVDNVGPNTVGDGSGQFGGNYAAYSQHFVSNFASTQIPGCNPTHVAAGTTSRVFVGQRAEGFAVNLGGVFDTVNFTAGATAGHANVIGAQSQSTCGPAGTSDCNDIANHVNVTTIAIEVPAECVANASGVMGVWSTASIPQARVINPTPTFAQPDREGGPLVEVSRLGMPLVNEVVIGLPDKDRWNSSEPSGDGSAGGFATYIVDPTLPQVLAALFGGAGVQAPTGTRDDLVEVFATGIPGLNQITATNPTVAEEIRINVNPSGTNAVPVTAANAQNSPLGILGCLDNPTSTTGATIDLANSDCDPFGFPNGRRPGDDVTDITLRAAMGGLLSTTTAPTGGCLHLAGATNGSGTAISTGNNVTCLNYGDGAANNQTTPTSGTIGLKGTGTQTANFLTSGGAVIFPYLNTPLAGGAN